MTAILRALRGKVYDSADALGWALGGLYQIWYAHREQHDGDFGRRPAARRRFALPLEH